MLSIRQLTKHFDTLTALSDVDLTVKRGSIYGLVGTNGAGKTTLLKIIAGIYRPSSGTAQLETLPIYENDLVKSRLHFLPDLPYFFPQNSLTQMGQWYSQYYPNWNESRFNLLVEGFGLNSKKAIDKMSKGTQRQAAFCLALSTMPDLLILDEPLDGLDPVMRHKVKNLLIQDVAERSMSVLISSHNLRELEDLCDTIGVLHQGKLLLEKDLDDMKRQLHKIQVAYEGETPALNGLDILHTDERGSITLYVVRGEYDLVIQTFQLNRPLLLDVLPLTLEEIFIYEMGEYGYEIQNIIL